MTGRLHGRRVIVTGASRGIVAGIRVNAVRPRSAVATAGALSAASNLVGTRWFVPESLEASLDILEREKVTVHGLDGRPIAKEQNA